MGFKSLQISGAVGAGDPITPVDGTQNLVGALSASGSITAEAGFAGSILDTVNNAFTDIATLTHLISPTAATGTITCVAKANLIDGETVTISDGTNVATVFEFDVTGNGVTGGRTQVNVSTDTTAAEVRARLVTAINSVVGGLTVTASSGGGAVVNLVNDNATALGNVTITDTVADAGFTHTGMSGGISYPTTAYGPSLLFLGKDGSGNTAENMGRVGFLWSDATAASEDSDFVVQVRTAGAALAEVVRFTSLGNLVLPNSSDHSIAVTATSTVTVAGKYLLLLSGDGGLASGASAGGTAGYAALSAGNGGAASSGAGAAGVGGYVATQAGAGGNGTATGDAGAGGAWYGYAGSGGSATNVGGLGGDWYGGAGSGTGAKNGGNTYLDAGAHGVGGGTHGTLNLGTLSTTSRVNIGANTVVGGGTAQTGYALELAVPSGTAEGRFSARSLSTTGVSGFDGANNNGSGAISCFTTGSAYASALLGSAAAAAAHNYLRCGAGPLTIGTAASAILEFSTNNLVRMTIDTTGASTLSFADAATNTAVNMLTLDHRTSGTAAVGYGTGILFTGEDASNNADDMARMYTAWTNATSTTEASSIVFQTRTGGAALADAVYMNSSGLGAGAAQGTGNSAGVGLYAFNAASAGQAVLTAESTSSTGVAAGRYYNNAGLTAQVFQRGSAVGGTLYGQNLAGLAGYLATNSPVLVASGDNILSLAANGITRMQIKTDAEAASVTSLYLSVNGVMKRVTVSASTLASDAGTHILQIAD